MPKNKKQAKVCCTDHLFNIQPQLPDCYYQDHIKVSLCPHYDKHGNCSGKKTFEGPIYNRDRMASTPAFVLRSEKDKFKYNGSLLGNENAQKYFNGCESKSELLFPKPSSKSFYCNVCKQKYEDYRQHIQGDKHKNKIHTNPFSKHILKLATKYEKQRSFKEKQKSAFPPTLSQGTNLIIIDQESEEEILSKPSKRVKIQQNRDQHKKANQDNIPFLNAYGFLQAQQIIAQQRIFEYYTAVNQMLLNPMTLGYNGYPFQMQAPGNPYIPDPTNMFYSPAGMVHMQQPFLRCLPAVAPSNPGNLRGQAQKQQLIIIQDDI